ncbi:MAG: YcgN family cysteine cluster protein [Oleiphilaceae bacterium]|nr:YcgN family cysteine cluster protein [Oleiphilaceae bacterium]
MAEAVPFWEAKSLTEMSQDEWESLCDGCGKCCLHKLEDETSGEVVFTSVACRYLDHNTCRCTEYTERKRLVPECWTLRQEDIDNFKWLPATCAYRLLNEGHTLPVWHPLVSGDKESVHLAQMSMQQRCISETAVAEDDWDLYIIDNLD